MRRGLVSPGTGVSIAIPGRHTSSKQILVSHHLLSGSPKVEIVMLQA